MLDKPARSWGAYTGTLIYTTLGPTVPQIGLVGKNWQASLFASARKKEPIAYHLS